jgi:hypothetical protein
VVHTDNFNRYCWLVVNTETDGAIYNPGFGVEKPLVNYIERIRELLGIKEPSTKD